MSQNPTSTESLPAGDAAESPKTNGGQSVPFRNPKKSKPTQVLPSDRLTCEKQLEALRAFVAAFDATGQPITNDEAGKIITMSGQTVIVTNAFFSDVGLLIRADAGKFTPGQLARDYQAAHVWDANAAGGKLAPAFRDTWFAKALIPRLQMRALTKSEAIAVLAEACKASPEYQGRLAMILDFLNAAAVISLAGDEVRAGTVGSGVASSHSGGGGGGGGDDGGKPETPSAQIKAIHAMLLEKFPPFDPAWPDDIKTKWFAGFEQLMKSADVAPK